MDKNCEVCRFRDNIDTKWTRCLKCSINQKLNNSAVLGDWFVPMTEAQAFERSMEKRCTNLYGNFDTGYTYVTKEEEKYMKNDVKTTKKAYHKMYRPKSPKQKALERIKKVIFNDPCTIVFWADGTKTIVKCGKDDVFDQEKGLAMAISKYFFGNTGYFNDVFKKWVSAEDEKPVSIDKNLAVSDEECDILTNAITVKEYCQRYNVTKNTVYKMIKNGDLYAFKSNKGKWIISIYQKVTKN